MNYYKDGHQRLAARSWSLSVCLGLSLAASSIAVAELRPLSDLPKTDEASKPLIELGKMLFFDGRVSGDATTSCATCHDPSKSFTDGLALSKGYPGTLYFRNTPTLINAASQEYFYWDGRMSGDDLPSLVRDHIAEAHFMQADGRLVIERMRQVPAYEKRFMEAAGGEPSYGKILNAIAAFVSTLKSKNVPLDKYLGGDEAAMDSSAIRGYELFKGKANCINCHDGPMLTDNKFHKIGTPANADVVANPERHITFRRFMRTIGIGQCATLRKDIGYQCVTKSKDDSGKFRTPSLREVSRTAPYMHDGNLATLEDVVSFYNKGSDQMKPLDLTDPEQIDLVQFLKQLTGDEIKVDPLSLPAYELRELGKF